MPKERLDKILSNLGYCSRSQLRKQLERVKVAGQPALKPDQKADWSEVTWDDQPLDPDPLWILLHKPAGLTCSHRDAGPLIYELFPERYLARKPALSSVGRLDRDTTGVLLFTTDGGALHRLTSPRSQIDKVYRAELTRQPSESELERIRAGGWTLEGDDKPLMPCQVQMTGPLTVELVLQEGRYHQVKRMWSALDNPVTSLHRERFGPFGTGDLQPGQYRLLNPEEVAPL